jgi:ABC-type multidrug transport system ATPase subunit
MEEADLLSDMVAIMRKGDVAALGTPLELKAEYGSALRFNILVGRTAVAETKLEIEKKFPSGDWVEVDAAETGNITVTIKQISQEKGEEGVDVEDLTNFVAWLESDDSHVDEYGFSNSSLEEVFLKVTAGDIEAEDEDAEELDVCCPGCNTGFLRCCLRGPCRCCCCPRSKRHSHDADEEMLDEVTQEVNGTELVADIKPTISLRQQVFGILLFSFQRSWTGKASIASWIIYGLIFVGVVVVGISGAGFYDRATAATAPTTALSLILINVSSLIYSDRRFGLFYLMRSQGLMASSYLVGYGLYAFLLNLSIGFVFLLGFFVTPLFRDPQECPDDQWGFTSSCYQWGERTPADRFRREFYQWNDTTEDGEPVTVFLASRVGGAGGLIGALFCFAYAMPGAIFASTYMPGHRIALVLLSVLILGLSVTPLILYFILNFGKTEEELNECRWDICNTTLSSFNIDNVGQHGEEFLNCMGLQAYGYDSIGGLCLPAVTGLIPQFGLFQTIAMTLMAGIEFTSDPPEYADQVLMPKLGGDCDGNICRFPFAKDLYYKNIGFMLIGGMLLLVVGLLLVFTFTFPVKPVLAVKGRFTHAWRNLFARKPRGKTSTGKSEDDDGPLEEVISESEHVQSVLDSMPQNDSPAGLPPVLTHKLRKVYPSLGGLPPKVALDSLDLHVPKGQVLGLLGKNGAGKTSVLKILSVAHEADDGLALIAGYNVATEQINVFEHLGNCQQFDVVWSSKSVQSHLEFFAQLKGIPRAKVKSTAHSIASSVGLGSPSVYRRTAGALSGGMRRRLSIGISLIGAPDVLLLVCIRVMSSLSLRRYTH